MSLIADGSPAAAQALPLRSERTRPVVLLVEDDALLRGTLHEVLQHEGYDVHCAGNGAGGIALLQNLKSIDCILLDWYMPHSDGAAFCRAQREHAEWRAIPTILFTGEIGTLRENALTQHAMILLKPTPLGTLLRCVAQMMHAAPLGQTG